MICEKLAARGLSEAEIEDITWNNALEFLRANLPE
jgi:microsomal dipeptidase-like Zn-dependent dipeptidase